MAEHRKPNYILLLKNPSNNKTSKVEIFGRELFTKEPLPGKCRMPQYRLRVNGKWYPGGRAKQYYASWEIKELFWRSLPF